MSANAVERRRSSNASPLAPSPASITACAALAEPRAREQLRESFSLAMSGRAAFGEAFYSRLFQLAPSARALFPAELGPQQHKLVQALLTLMRSLDAPEALVPTLRKLGARHLSYGARPAHYAVVGEALLDTLDQVGPSPLTIQARALWMQFYGWVAAVMLEGADAAEQGGG